MTYTRPTHVMRGAEMIRATYRKSTAPGKRQRRELAARIRRARQNQRLVGASDSWFRAMYCGPHSQLLPQQLCHPSDLHIATLMYGDESMPIG